ncbi:hypothetical protein HDU89_005041 [Geranomyces variabilis]|nr:hypothetical protein HDU89_005041 [Geranomyces variabilis]
MTSTLKSLVSVLLALATASTLFHTSSTSPPLRSLIAAIPLAVSALSLLSGHLVKSWTVGEILSALVAAAGVWLRTAAVNELDAFFGYKTTIEKGHRLVNTGPYSVLLHPAYAGNLLALSSFGHFHHVPTFIQLCVPLITAGVYAVRIRREEVLLRQHFREEWDRHAATRWRIVPGVW